MQKEVALAVIDVISRWIELVSLVFLTGTVLCRLWVLDGQSKSPDETIFPGMWRPFGPAIGAMVVAATANIMAQISKIGGTPFFTSANMLPAVISGTHFGHVWIYRVSLLVFLAIVLLISGKKGRDGRLAPFLMLIILLLVSVTESAYGHPADKGDFTLRELNDWFHLLGAMAWGGGLLALSTLILPKIIKTPDIPEPDNQSARLADIASRFSAMAGIAVAVMAITAIFNYLTYVGSSRALMGTPAGLTVLAKIILFLIIVNLGAFNRYLSVPALKQWASFPAHNPGFSGRAVRRIYLPFVQSRSGNQMALLFKRLVRLEMFLVLALLLCAAILSHVPPASHYYMHMNQMGTGSSQSPGSMQNMGGM